MSEKRFTEEELNAAVANERRRCEGIVQLAREGIVDGDFRSIKSVIASGSTVESIRAEAREME